MAWMNRLLLGSLIIGAFFRALPVSTVSAQNGQSVSNVALNYEFGSRLRIEAQIAQPAEYSSFALILQPDGQSPRELTFTPDADGSFAVTHDLTQDPLKPFARIYYWFELVKSDGTPITTPSYWFDYVDDRFAWQSSETALFQISWVEGDAAFGQKLQQIAREGLQKAAALLPVNPRLPLRIYVYPEVESMQQALSLAGQNWTAGHASPDIGVILVSNDGQTSELIEMERQIPHELMHVLEYQLTGEHYASIPVWLNEGLAASAELYPDPDLQRTLNEAHANATLLSFGSLCDGFPQDAGAAQLAYAQSASLVKFIEGRFGSVVFPKLLENASSGLTCENSVDATLSLSLVELQQEWMTAAFKEPPLEFSFEIFLPILIAGGILLMTAVIFTLRTRRTRGRK